MTSTLASWICDTSVGCDTGSSRGAADVGTIRGQDNSKIGIGNNCT